MEVLLKFINDLITSGGVPKSWLAVAIGLTGLGGLIYYLIKAVLYLNTYLKNPALENAVTKEEINAIKNTFQTDNKAILKILDDVGVRLKSIETSNGQVLELNKQLEHEIALVNRLADEIKDLQQDEVESNIAVRKDLSSLVSDSKAQYVEITRQVQGLQKDLASLQGTIIGLSTQRSRLM